MTWGIIVLGQTYGPTHRMRQSKMRIDKFYAIHHLTVHLMINRTCAHSHISIVNYLSSLNELAHHFPCMSFTLNWHDISHPLTNLDIEVLTLQASLSQLHQNLPPPYLASIQPPRSSFYSRTEHLPFFIIGKISNF